MAWNSRSPNGKEGDEGQVAKSLVPSAKEE